MRRPWVALTAGDPCGIGPEVILKALAHPPRGACLAVIGDLPVFERTARRLGRPLPRWRAVRPGSAWPAAPLLFLDLARRPPAVPGKPTAADGAAALAYLDAAMRLARRGRVDALVTGPVTKQAVALVAPGFVGQTEHLARGLRARGVVMLFVAGRIRVALLTRHLPLRDVPRAVTRPLLASAARRVDEALRRQFGLRHPRLAVCGLNPHAGEGSAASEERRVVEPFLRRLRREGFRCDGPFAADGFFARRPGHPAGRATEFDAVLCPYHDQGLVAFKLLAGGRGCQMSVGLPVIRTSPDHGTGLDIAGKGLASPASMRYALRLAIRLARKSGTGTDFHASDTRKSVPVPDFPAC